MAHPIPLIFRSLHIGLSEMLVYGDKDRMKVTLLHSYFTVLARLGDW